MWGGSVFPLGPQTIADQVAPLVAPVELTLAEYNALDEEAPNTQYRIVED
jgi:hypothetical protein